MRTLQATVATDKPIYSTERRTGRAVLEALVLEGGEWLEQVPLLLDHQRQIPYMVGSAREFRIESGGRLAAMLSFAENHSGANDAWALANGRHARSVSLGYQPIEVEELPPGRTLHLKGRTFTAPANDTLRVVTRWRAREVSLTPIPADDAAMIRSHSFDTEATRTLPEAIARGAKTFQDLFIGALRTRGEFVPHNDVDVIRAGFASVVGVDAFNGLVRGAILDGYRMNNDTTAGWVRTVPLPNFLPSKLAISETPVRLSKIGRGGTAATVAFGLSDDAEWRLARFACQFQFDEMDMLDTEEIGLLQVALAEVGMAARRMIPDMIYALLLTNAAIADGVALFHTSRGNIASGGGSALQESAIDAGLAAIASQCLADNEGDPVHLGLAAKYLMVPPDDIGKARRYVCQNWTGEGDLEVRPESRLSTVGLVDPRDDSIIAGNGNNWLLAAPEEQAAGIVLGLLDGQREPSIRITPLTQGEFGVNVDVKLDLGVCAIDGRPLYWAVGQ